MAFFRPCLAMYATLILIIAADDAAVKAKLAQTTSVGAVSVTMKSVWLGVLALGFMMAFSGKIWTLNIGFNAVPAVFAAMTAMSSQQKNPSLPQSDNFPIAVGCGVFLFCYFICWMYYPLFMAVCAGFLAALVGVIGVGSIGTPSFPMMSLAAAGIGFLSGAFLGWNFNESDWFNRWIVRFTSGLLMGVSTNAISTGGDIMVTFMNSVAKARENPAYINDARKASIILATEWATFAFLAVFGGPVIDCIWDTIADACGCAHRGDGDADGKVGDETEKVLGADESEVTTETPLSA